MSVNTVFGMFPGHGKLKRDLIQNLLTCSKFTNFLTDLMGNAP